MSEIKIDILHEVVVDKTFGKNIESIVYNTNWTQCFILWLAAQNFMVPVDKS